MAAETHSPDRIAQRILVMRGERVLLDSDLAALYGVSTKRLNQQVKRNRRRFPTDFVFRLTSAERDQVVANCDHLSRLRFSPNLPYAYTEHGALMAASVLSTAHAVEISVYVVRAFVALRMSLVGHKEIARRLDQLERKFGTHDGAIAEILDAVRQLAVPPELTKRRRIGFVQD